MQPRVGPPFLGPAAVLPWVTTPHVAPTLKGLYHTFAHLQSHTYRSSKAIS